MVERFDVSGITAGPILMGESTISATNAPSVSVSQPSMPSPSVSAPLGMG